MAAANTSKSGQKNYTKPDLRARIEERVKRGSKGGRPGQWSARKAQLVTQEYEKAGGGYKGPRDASQKHLKEWGDERWSTRDHKPAKRGKTMARYLPEKAWKELTPAERKATDARKRKASRKGKQFVANTPAAKKARARATAHGRSKRAR